MTLLTEHYNESVLELALQDAVYENCICGDQEDLAAFEEYLKKLESNTLTEQDQTYFIEIINESFYSNLEKYSGVLYEFLGYNNNLKTLRLNVPKTDSTPKSSPISAQKTSAKEWLKDAPYRTGSAIRSGVDKAKNWYNLTKDKLKSTMASGVGYKQRLDNYKQQLDNTKNNFLAGYKGQQNPKKVFNL
jgi:hypothetical protein